MDGVHPDLVIGPATEVLAGNGKILTAGGIDCHVHFICPQIVAEALGAGRHHAHRRRHRPGRGHQGHHGHPGRLVPRPDARGDGPAAGQRRAAGQGQHRAPRRRCGSSCGPAPAASSCTRTGAPRRPPSTPRSRWPASTGVQVALHTDTLNEAGFVEDTLAAIAGRSIHAYHTEGAGGGHAPDIITVAGHPNVLPSIDEPDPAAHGQHPRRAPRHADGLPPPEPAVPEDLAFAESRIRPTTIAAEDLLHDLGAISMIGSDAQAMGRVGEVVLRTWQTAHVMKRRARRAGRRRRRRQPAGPPLRRQVHDLPGRRARHRRRGRLGRAGQAGRPGAVGPDVLRRPAARRPQGRDDRLGADGRRQRLDPDPAAGAARGRCSAPTAGCRPRRRVHFVAPGGDRGRAGRPAGRRPAAGAGHRHHAGWARRTCRRTPRCPTSRSTRTRSPCRIDGEVWEPEPVARAADGPAVLPVLMTCRAAHAGRLPAARRRPHALRRRGAGDRRRRASPTRHRWRRSCAVGWRPPVRSPPGWPRPRAGRGRTDVVATCPRSTRRPTPGRRRRRCGRPPGSRGAGWSGSGGRAWPHPCLGRAPRPAPPPARARGRRRGRRLSPAGGRAGGGLPVGLRA